ncbi:MAG: GNAT family N-acetyltransferase [Actinobacteria bacterium]|nr:MAG: GNAT family N-acetyltransferase [Actinomycetota bacterium]
MNADFDMPYPQYRCPTCGKDLPLGEARMTVTCANHTERPAVEFTVRRAEAADTTAIETICDRAMGETVVDVFGGTFDVLDAVNHIAEENGELVGLLSLFVHQGEATVILLSVYPDHQGTGVGSALLDAADAWAAERGLQFVRVAVTNDDIPLIYFYQRHGFAIYDAAIGEVADRFGSATPGFSSIPVRDEFRMRRAVCAK